jgi:hypothetical protein
MGKRRARSQIGSLTSDHQKSGIDLFPTSKLKVQHGVGKISTRATTLVQTSTRSDSAVGSYEFPKSRDSNRDSFGTVSGQFRDNFGTPIWESREKEPFGCSLGGALQRILYWGRWLLPLSLGRGESCGPKCPWLVPTPKGVPECETNPMWLVFWMQIQA